MGAQKQMLIMIKICTRVNHSSRVHFGLLIYDASHFGGSTFINPFKCWLKWFIGTFFNEGRG